MGENNTIYQASLNIQHSARVTQVLCTAKMHQAHPSPTFSTSCPKISRNAEEATSRVRLHLTDTPAIIHIQASSTSQVGISGLRFLTHSISTGRKEFSFGVSQTPPSLSIPPFFNKSALPAHRGGISQIVWPARPSTANGKQN